MGHVQFVRVFSTFLHAPQHANRDWVITHLEPDPSNQGCDKSTKTGVSQEVAGFFRWGDGVSDVFRDHMRLAAFLKSKSESEQQLMIWPSFLGPISIISFSVLVAHMVPKMVFIPHDAESYEQIVLVMWLIGSFAGFVLVSVLRGYFRSLALLEQQLNSVNFDKTRSRCCEVNHREGQETILCDRRIVKACVSKWFGSEKAFEACIRSEVMQAVMSDLQYQVFTRSGILSVTCPFMWGFLDIAVSWASIGEWSRAVQHCLDCLTGWLLVTPMLAELVVCLSHRYCGKASSPFREVLMNLRVLILIIPACVLVSALRQIYGRAFE